MSRVEKTASVLTPALLIAAVLAGFALAATRRVALWTVVQACQIDHELTGSALPCLEVNVSAGSERGYVVLRPPVGVADLILSPTRKISGIEDPSLEADGAPNYFEMAWRARSILDRGRALARENFGLAVNSRFARTQDQLHIHIGCLSSETKRSIASIARGLSPSRWRRLDRPLRGFMFWGRVIDQDSLDGVNTFRLIGQGLPEADLDRGAVTIVLAGSRDLPKGDGFVLLASVDDHSHPWARSGSDLLEHSCL